MPRCRQAASARPAPALATIVALAIVGCGGRPHPGDLDGSLTGDSGDGSQAGDRPTCSWDPRLDQADGSTKGCFASRALLRCTMANGTVEVCLSDTLTACPGPDMQPGVAVVSCEDQCTKDEYAVGCWATPSGGGARPSPPAGCREVAVDPGGNVSYCCLCT